MKKLIVCAICAICGFTAANAQAKFGHVNTQEIIQAMPEYATAKAEIDKLTSQYEDPAELSGQPAGSPEGLF